MSIHPFLAIRKNRKIIEKIGPYFVVIAQPMQSNAQPAGVSSWGKESLLKQFAGKGRLRKDLFGKKERGKEL